MKTTAQSRDELQCVAALSQRAGRWTWVVVAALVSAAMTQGCASSKSGAAGSSQSGAATEQSVASMMLKVGGEHADGMLSYSQTEAIRNMLGGARGIFVAPDISGEAALLGVETGTGFVLRSHGKDWSDPVFFKLSATSVGYQAGAKSERMLILIMTDSAVDNFVKGKMELGASGGFAVGNYGAGASGAGSMKGGLELLIITTNTGAFLGGGWGETKTDPATKLNEDIYGPNADLVAILNAPGGKYAPAAGLRAKLSKMVQTAWNGQAK